MSLSLNVWLKIERRNVQHSFLTDLKRWDM